MSDQAVAKWHALSFHPPRKLSDQAVMEIRRLLAAGVEQSVIAQRFGVHRSWVCRIGKGRARNGFDDAR